MYLLTALSLGTLALSAHGFLIPGDIESLDTKATNPSITAEKDVLVSVDCTSCPYALNSERNGGHEWTNDIASDLEFKIDSDGNTLRLNGVPFYPIQTPGLPPQLHVSQKKKEGEELTMEGFQGNLRMSYSLEYEEKRADDGNSLLTVVMTIMALDGQMVRIDDVVIKTIKDQDGKVWTLAHPHHATATDIKFKLLLHSANTQPTTASDAKCENILCRVFSKIITSIQKAKEATKTKVKSTCNKVKCICQKCWQAVTGKFKHIHPAAPKTPEEPAQIDEDMDKLPTHHRFRPGMFGGRPPHRHHRHHPGFLRHMGHVMWNTMKMAFMPVLIGIAFGMAASAIGMLVGQLVVFLWMKYRKNEQVVYVPVDTDVKDSLPAYQDVPTLEITVEKEGEDQA
ncbi:uncharacterized protein KY384_000592 [Bacidia gigantensis]|uniref:uncharacterized protein n=1 Tax=Bacidia gigantensis TaxID=2732470 RepID=UPI001D03DED5|nr:uncharacterized protein KY384_000592 [Bacidia gigantensis]KAG8525832.1 hypothetical protein KY384_000592 [Bacidia gigantensis]